MTSKSFLVVAATGLALAACAQNVTTNPAVKTTHVPTVSSTMLAHDLTYAQPDDFQAGELAELDQWLSSVDVRYGDRISLDDPNPVGAEARRALVQRIVGQRGLLVREYGPVTTPELPTGVTRVVVVRTTASVPECPDHSRPSNPNMQVSTTSNYSCAVQGNMAAMIADPNDLVSGKPYSGSVAATDGSASSSAQDASSANGTVYLVPSSQ